jgi:hypothetical protein
MEEWELFGFIRQEGEKYFLRNLIGVEGLAYDLSVNEGDTLTLENPFGVYPVEAIVTGIDSIFIEPAQEFRKRITLYEYQFYQVEEYWVEGIGSLAGLTHSGMDLCPLTGGHDFTLLCYFEDDGIRYKTTQYELCFYPLVNIPEKGNDEIVITFYPNPVYDVSHLMIQNPENKNCSISILNVSGQLIQKLSVTSSCTLEIGSNDFQAGIYFYSVCDEHEQICFGKFIIQ